MTRAKLPYILNLRRHLQGSGLKAQLLRSGVGSALVRIVTQLLLLALAILLARGLGAGGYGIYSYAIAILGLLRVAAEVGVPTLLMREVATSQEKGDFGLVRGAITRAAQLVSLAAICVSAIGFLVLWVSADRLSTKTLYTTALMLAVLPISTMARTVTHALRGLQRVFIAQTVEMAFGPLLVTIAAVAVFLAWPSLREPQVAMAIQLVAACTMLLGGMLVLRHFLPAAARSTPVKYESRRWFNSAVPFTLVGGAGIINSQADLIMLGLFSTAENVGIYRVAVQGAALVAFSLQVANTVVAPHFARLYAKGEIMRLQRLVTISARIIFSLALPIGLVGILAGGTVAGWLFGKEFTVSHLPLAILAGGHLVNTAMGSVGLLLNMTGHERETAMTLWQTALLNVGLNAILIPLYGTTGAAIASAFSIVLWNVMLFRLAYSRLGIRSTAFARTS